MYLIIRTHKGGSMKSWLLIIMLCLSVAGCGWLSNNDDSAADNPDAETEDETADETEENKGDGSDADSDSADS